MLKARHKKVIIVIPGGTKPEIEILLNHLSHEVNYFDECHLWVNTDSKERIDYMQETAKRFPFVQCVYRDFGIKDTIAAIGMFTDKCVKDNIYIRLDNDIVFIEHGAIKRLVNFRIKNNDLFLVYGNVINNPYNCARCWDTYINKCPSLAYGNEIRCSCDLMLRTHKVFLDNCANYNKYYCDSFRYSSTMLTLPINVISWFGNSLKQFGRTVGNEESFLVSRPATNGVCGNALFSHLTYACQREQCYKSGRNQEYLKIRKRYYVMSKCRIL